ncbi:MAG: hypothetical protein K6V97_08075 [Actinomycetia bacterium]|nr:hypothetical protein [Actinomycetes bacterium]
MDRPRLARAARRLAAWTLAAAFGAALAQARDRAVLARLENAVHVCRLEADKLAAEADRLRETLAREGPRTPRRLRIEAVDLRIVGPDPGYAEVAHALEPLTGSLLGTEPDASHLEVLWRLFEGRLLAVRGRWYRLSVRAVLVWRVTTILVSLTPVPGPGPTPP